MPSDSVDDSSESSETSASETVFSTDTGLTPPPPPPRRGGTATGTKSSPSRNKSGKNPFDSMIEDWMGDEPSVFSVDSRANSGTFPSSGFGRSGGHGGILAGIGAGRNNARNPNHRLVDIPNVDDGRGTRGNAQPDHDNDDDNDAHAVEDGKKKGKKKKLVPYTSSSSRSPKPFPPMTRTITPPLRRNDALDSAPPSERRLDDRPKCYLIQGTQTQGSLIEQYVLRPLPDGSSSSSSPPNYLAHWSPPKDRTIPKFKFASSNYGKSELVNATQGDLRGKRAYYSGICQWLRSAKTFLGEVVFVRHVVGWECDLYFYFGDGGGGGRGWTLVELFGHDVPDDGFGRHVPRQTVLLRDGQPFGHLDKALAVAIVPRGSDFLHYDPRFQTSIEKWVAEGSKLGFASKLDVRAGSGYPKQASHRAVGDAARPSGGKWYNDVAREYEIDEGGGEGEGPWESRKRRSDLETEGKGNIAEQERNDVVKKAVGVVASREMRRFSSPKQSEVEGTSQQTPQNQPTKLPHPSSANGGIRRRSSQESITSATGISSTTPRLKSKSPIVIEPIPQESRMTPGTHVYVRDAHYSWIPATVLAHPDSLASPAPRLRVRIRLPSDWEDRTIVPKGGDPSSIELERTVKLSDYPNRELPLQNLEKDGKTVMGKNDMADLPNLHEAAILYNLKERHSGGVPYTRVGDIMVAMNPFQWIDGLYSEEKKFFYAKNLIWQAQPKPTKPVTEENGNQPLATAASERQAIGYEHEKLGIDPHVFETASLAYLGLALDGSDQTILVTGESGAGKTETIKIVMNHLATVERSRPNWPESDRDMGSEHGSDTVNRVLRANPVFEAFGNAKTLRNDNSSRFGKFTQLQFDVEDTSYANLNGRAIPSCLLAGSKCITYLLEKSRVVSVSQGERTYHIFYQLLEAPDEIKKEIWEEGLVGASTADFNYLSTSSAQEHGFDSGEEWTETVDALSTFGIKGDAFFNVMRSLCVILQLGNLTFEPEVVDGEERSSISSIEALEKLSTLMGVPESEIETAMTKRFMITRGEEFTISLKDSEARDGCDALAKEIYARVFDYLVRKINECTEPKGSADGVYGTISLLDIFGFESFQVNRFEQLCINYANERLQQKYVVDNFRAIKVEYEEEGINVFDFSLIDNSDVMDLLEGKMGLMVQLNEECVRPNGGDESFVYKLKVVCSDSNRLIQDNLHRPYEFGIRHYAAPIKYDARKFIERNLDKIPNDLLKCACHSANPLIRQEFQRLSDSLKEGQSTGLKKRSAATKHLVATKFRSQLTSLMSIIEESRTRYIRCVKPNKVMRPRTLDHAHTVSQLESAGLVTAIVISRESFPNRLSYDVIMERFKFLTYKYADCHLDTGDIKQDSEILLSHLLAGITADTHMGRVRPFACGKTKVYFRVGALERIETIRQEYYAERAIQLQTWVRSLQARIHYLIMKRGMILLESQIRCYLVRRSYKMKLKCALIVQCFIRRVLAKLEYLRRRNNHAATVIQTRWRVIKPRREFRAAHLASIKIQSIARMTICKKVYAAKKKERDAEHAMESRMTMMQQNFDDASTVGGGGTVFSVDEGLLEEVETMFEFLRKEIVVLRKKNTKLKRELAESEAEKREMFNHASSTEHAFALSKIRSEQLTRNNAQLTENANRFKKEISKLKTELKTQQYGHELQLREMRQEFDMALERRDAEVKTLESKLQTTTAMHKREVQLITDDAERNREENYAEIMRLREEIKRTQDSHQDYLSKLMGVLETTQANRSTSPDAEELIREKDSQIIELQTELAKLQKSTGTTPQDNKTRKDTIRSMKYIVKKNREHRKVRVQEIDQLVNQLEVRLSPDVRSESQDIIDSLRDAIQYDEKCNSKMDREVVNMIEHSSSYYIPLDVSNQNADYGAIVAENQKLRRKLEKKYTCKKCGFRREKKDHHDDDGSGDFGDSTMIESAVGGSSSKFLESVVEE